MFASNIQHHPAETMENIIFLYISVPFGGALPQQLSVDLQPRFVLFPPKKKHQKWDGLKTTKYFKITRSNLLKRKLPVASIKFLLSHTNIPYYYPIKIYKHLIYYYFILYPQQ
jgi:hypothetical protein